MDNEKGQKLNEFTTPAQKMWHWVLLAILWLLLYFELYYIIDIAEKWSNPFYLSANGFFNSRLAEILAFALCVVMSLYTAGISIFFVILLLKQGYKNLEFYALVRLHLLAITSFVIYWGLFMLFASFY